MPGRGLVHHAVPLAIALAGLVACGRHKPLAPRDAGPDGDGGGADAGASDVADVLEAPSDLAPDAASDAVPDVDAADAVEERPILESRCLMNPLRESFYVRCATCHNDAGPANPRYPDLYAFKGTAYDFLVKTRTGVGRMPAYMPTLISDADIMATFSWFTSHTRPPLDDKTLGGIKPLFTVANAVGPPIVTKRDDGAIVTTGAGRLHIRHEMDSYYGPYLPNYWDQQSYGFVVEDFTTTATPHIRTTYLPAYVPGSTEWGAWKASGANNTFLHNVALVDVASPPFPPPTPVGGVQQIDETVAPGTHSFAAGQNFEFEFRFVQRDGTMHPFSDTFRYRIGLGGLTADTLADYKPGPSVDAQLGGNTTLTWLYYEPADYFDQMALDMQQQDVQLFLEGRRLFNTDFASGANVEMGQAPFPEQAGKAGPLHDANACATCHPGNGAGVGLDGQLGPTSSMVFRLSDAGDLGTQLELQQGSAQSDRAATKTVQLLDGTQVKLTKPNYIVAAGTGAAPKFSARIAPALVGLGLIEALDERALIARADPLDCDADGISGRVSVVLDPRTGDPRVGRFGWKAEKASVIHQVADDLVASLGVSSSVLQDALKKVELSDDDLGRLTTFVSLLGVPPQRQADDPQVQDGALLFQTVGCASCHVTDAVTSPNHPFVELRAQAIKLYSDLLLHDMGPDLADNSGVGPDPSHSSTAPATASEWRTPPLWGIGLRATVNGNSGLLHDGRAANVLEAVLWHGGEATRIVATFMSLSAVDREALLAFVQSL
jgi:CxxC motif-containing protein (DUF1111 family)